MATKRWEKLAMESITGETVANARPEAYREQVAKMRGTLARQHRAFVRLVKKMQNPYLSCVTEKQRIRHVERVDMCAEILAALAKQASGKKN